MSRWQITRLRLGASIACNLDSHAALLAHAESLRLSPFACLSSWPLYDHTIGWPNWEAQKGLPVSSSSIIDTLRNCRAFA